MIREMIKIQYYPFKRDLPLIVTARDQGKIRIKTASTLSQDNLRILIICFY